MLFSAITPPQKKKKTSRKTRKRMRGVTGVVTLETDPPAKNAQRERKQVRVC